MIGLDMTNGPIIKKLIRVSIPVLITNVINMAYNLTDMFWLGKVSQNALSAVGTIGLFMWLAQSVAMLARTSTEIKVAQAYGEKDMDKVNRYNTNGVAIVLVIAVVYCALMHIFKEQIIGMFNFESAELAQMSMDYLVIANVSIFFMIVAQVFIAIYNGIGNTKMVFYFVAIGLAINMILDPLLIITFDLGVEGAAIATTVATSVMFIIFIIYSKYKTTLLQNFRRNLELKKIVSLLKLGLFPMLTNVLFTGVYIILSVLVVKFGDANVAVNRIGTQVESLTWIIGGAATTAITVYIGQNIGAKKFERSAKGYTFVLSLMVVYSVFVSLFFVFFGEEIFLFFLPSEPYTAVLGAEYLIIMAFSQAAMMIELVTAGMFNGRGKTILPSVIAIIGNVVRIPLMLFLSDIYGVNGIWIAVTITATLKGVLIFIAHLISVGKSKDFKFKYFIGRSENNA